MKNKNILFALGFANTIYWFTFCIIFNEKIHEIGFRKRDKKPFFIKTESKEMYNFLLIPNGDYFDEHYFITILTPKK